MPIGSIVAIVLLSVAAIACCYAAWFFLRIAGLALLVRALRVVTGRRKPDYARIRQLEKDDGLAEPEAVVATGERGFEAFRAGVNRIWTAEDESFRADRGEWRMTTAGLCWVAKDAPVPVVRKEVRARDKGAMLYHCPACDTDWISEAAIRAHREKEHDTTPQAAP